MENTNIETTLTLWVGYCSNPARSLDDCLQKTREVLGVSGFLGGWSGQEIRKVYLNRGRDAAFLERLFAEDNKELAINCVQAALDASLQGDDRVAMEPFFDGYAARYGDDPRLLTLRLRWLTLYTNYPKNIDEVERIMALLTAAPEKNPAEAN